VENGERLNLLSHQGSARISKGRDTGMCCNTISHLYPYFCDRAGTNIPKPDSCDAGYW